MKKLLIGILFLGAFQTNAQTCTRTGSLQETDVSIVGTVKLVQNGNTITVELGSDFLSDSGPDLDVYLSEEPNPVATGIRLDALISLSGAQAYDVPTGVNINDYQYIVIHCTQYNHLYGSALLGNTIGNCSIALGTNDYKKLNDFDIIQTDEGIQFKTNSNISNPKIQIYNLNGKLILESNTISELITIPNTGLYFITVTSKEGNFQQKVLVK